MVASIDRWRLHIVAKHAEVSGHAAAVAATIREPQIVTFDATYRDRENFYRFAALPRLPHLYLKVCVAFGPAEGPGGGVSGGVITAYPTPVVGRGEVQKWPSATSASQDENSTHG